MLEEGQEEWGNKRVMGEQGGGEMRQSEKRKKERDTGGRGRMRWRNKGKCTWGL